MEVMLVDCYEMREFAEKAFGCGKCNHSHLIQHFNDKNCRDKQSGSLSMLHLSLSDANIRAFWYFSLSYMILHFLFSIVHEYNY